MISGLERAELTSSCYTHEMCQWHKQPIPFDPLYRTQLIAVQCHFILTLAEKYFNWPSVHIIFSLFDCRKVKSIMCNGQFGSQFAEFLFHSWWIQQTVCFQSTNGMEPFLRKGIDYFFRNILVVTKEIRHYWWNRQFLCNVLCNVNFRNWFIVHYKSIIQDDAVAGKHNSNCLMSIILFFL